MIRLLLDIGNSRLKWALWRDGRLEPGGALEHGGDPAAAFAGLVPAAAPEQVWAANVTGAAHEAALAAATRARLGCELALARVQAQCSGLIVAYADPARLGVDRWMQMLAVWRERAGPLVVASAGTALTFDAVDAAGRHRGGVIAPGLLTAQQAVLGATRFAATGPDRNYDEGLGTDTEACVRQGALHACAGLVDRLAGRWAGPGAARVLTGGDAAALAPHLEGAWELRPDLVLEGLAALAASTRP